MDILNQSVGEYGRHVISIGFEMNQNKNMFNGPTTLWNRGPAHLI
jgi:hypothetical protein